MVTSLFPAFANIDIAYIPRFDADRFIDGERFRYWGGAGLTGSVQYYLEHRLDHDQYRVAFPGVPGTEADENRHVFTLRLTRMLMNQNLTLGLFVYWSPGD